MKTVKRPVDTSFWEDDKVVDLFTPEDKYFLLYLMTNPHTSQVGIYHLPYKIAAFELGYSAESVKSLLERFSSKYQVTEYSPQHQEVALLNALKHNIVKGGKPVIDCIKSELADVKDTSLISKVAQHLQDFWNRSSRPTDHVIQQIFDETLKARKEPKEVNNDNENDNENENERIVDDSSTTRSAKPNPSRSLKQEFDQLWKQYPNKSDKQSAFKYYKTWRKSGTEEHPHKPDYLSKQLGLYNQLLALNPDRPVLNGSTWFKGRFNDDYENLLKRLTKQSHHAEKQPQWQRDEEAGKPVKLTSPEQVEAVKKELAELKQSQ